MLAGRREDCLAGSDSAQAVEAAGAVAGRAPLVATLGPTASARMASVPVKESGWGAAGRRHAWHIVRPEMPLTHRASTSAIRFPSQYATGTATAFPVHR